MKHGNPTLSSPPELQAASPLVRWHVYNACHVLVATYSTEAAAASHIAAWPALYYKASDASLEAVSGS